jgi:hypothetical protein
LSLQFVSIIEIAIRIIPDFTRLHSCCESAQMLTACLNAYGLPRGFVGHNYPDFDLPSQIALGVVFFSRLMSFQDP